MNLEEEIITLREKAAVLEYEIREQREGFEKIRSGLIVLESMIQNFTMDPFGLNSNKRNNTF